MRQVRIEALPHGACAARFEAMASPCEILVDGAGAAELKQLGELAAAECWRIEHKWSRYRDDNIIHAINSANGAAVEVDGETASLIDFGEQLHHASEGRFDLSSGLFRRVWRFGPGATLPRAGDIATLLPRVGWSKVLWRRPLLQLRPGMELDLGGIGKEYAADRSLALLRRATAKPILVNLGGDVAASAPRADGAHWRIGIDSGVNGAATPLVHLGRGALATSGDQHRHITAEGRRYAHIIDPRTGWPPADAPRSVSVAAETCSEAGALSTVAILHGAGAETWLRSQGVDFHVVR